MSMLFAPKERPGSGRVRAYPCSGCRRRYCGIIDPWSRHRNVFTKIQLPSYPQY